MRRSPVFLIVCFALIAASAASPATASAAWVWPVRGDVITPYRNGTDPYASGQHRGIDIGAAVGTPVAAAAGGEVRFAGTAGSSGLTVSIRTSDGYDTSYLHLSSLAVRAGERVTAGERVGAVGTSGTRSVAAPHLHFGVRDAGTRHAYHDPLDFLPGPPGAPSPEPPVPAPAPSPSPASPDPVPAVAPLATAPGALPRAVHVRRPGALPGHPRPAPAPHAHRSPAARVGGAPLQLSAAERALDQRRAADPRAATHGHAEAPGEARLGRAGPGHTRRGRAPLHATQGAAQSGAPRGHALTPDSRRGAEAPTSEASPRTAPDSDGPDIAWLLACGGLLVAAAILGLREDGGATGTRAGARLSRALHRLAGRRQSEPEGARW